MNETLVQGILEIPNDHGYVRTSGYSAGPDDLYVPLSLIRKYGLRRGDMITGPAGASETERSSKKQRKHRPLVDVETINGLPPQEIAGRPRFESLTPVFPDERIHLEREPHLLTTRIIDLVMPIGKGQRAIIVAPPKAGKTLALQAIAHAIGKNHPDVHLMVVLVGERPEEVTDIQRHVPGNVIASTFDKSAAEHTALAELAVERARRLVEQGQDVVILLDSLTRLGRAYNLTAPTTGRVLTGGIASDALYPPKKLLGSARNIEGGGSLTIIASALIETGSVGDSVIYEELKSTGNAEMKLDRDLANRRIYPAIDIQQSGTRREESLLTPEELRVTRVLRRAIAGRDNRDGRDGRDQKDPHGIEQLLESLRQTRTNQEFLAKFAR